MKKETSFEELLESILPPPNHPLYQQHKRYNLEAEARADDIAGALCLPADLSGYRVLDVGSGTGGIAVGLARRGAEVFALEPNDTHPLLMQVALARAREAGVYIHPIIARGEEIPCAEGQFDLVILNDVIEHAHNPRAIVHECARVLSRRGLLYLSTPNKYSLPQILREGHSGLFGVSLLPPRLAAFYVVKVRRAKQRYTVGRIHSYGAVKRFLEEAGLDFVLLNRYRPVRHFIRDHPEKPATYRSWLARTLVKLASLPLLRPLAFFVVTRPSLQPGFLDFAASKTALPEAIRERCRQGLG